MIKLVEYDLRKDIDRFKHFLDVLEVNLQKQGITDLNLMKMFDNYYDQSEVDVANQELNDTLDGQQSTINSVQNTIGSTSDTSNSTIFGKIYNTNVAVGSVSDSAESLTKTLYAGTAGTGTTSNPANNTVMKGLNTVEGKASTMEGQIGNTSTSGTILYNINQVQSEIGDTSTSGTIKYGLNQVQSDIGTYNDSSTISARLDNLEIHVVSMLITRLTPTKLKVSVMFKDKGGNYYNPTSDSEIQVQLSEYVRGTVSLLNRTNRSGNLNNYEFTHNEVLSTSKEIFVATCLGISAVELSGYATLSDIATVDTRIDNYWRTEIPSMNLVETKYGHGVTGKVYSDGLMVYITLDGNPTSINGTTTLFSFTETDYMPNTSLIISVPRSGGGTVIRLTPSGSALFYPSNLNNSPIVEGAFTFPLKSRLPSEE